MRYLPFIAGSYGVTIALAAFLAVGAVLRLARAKRRLLAVERDLGRSRP